MPTIFNFDKKLFEIVDYNHLYFRRQFLLSSSPINVLPSWKATKIAKSFYLKVHPDLNLTQIEEDEIQLTLIGFFLDADDPYKSDTEILQDLVLSMHSNKNLFKATDRLAGRWILISYNKSDFILFSDPSGLRSVYYTNSYNLPFLCASQPGLIAHILDLNYSEEADRLFLQSSYKQADKEYWLPSGISVYNEIKHLVPNHYLDVLKKEQKRFWPWEKIKHTSFYDIAEQSSKILENLIECGVKRFKLALPITAGIDSRTLLAASKNFTTQIYFYTLLFWDLNEKSTDIQIPAILLQKFGLQHHTLNCSNSMNSDFRKIYLTNVDNAHESWGDIAFGLSKNYPMDRVCLKGNCSEIARCYYYKGGYPRKITGKTLAEFNGMDKNEFCIRQFERWLQQSHKIALDHNINVLDLFYWEHRMGSWQAISQLEWDIVQESYTPFNCRKLLNILLSADIRYRKPPNYKLFRQIIRNLWPSLLSEPINPNPIKKVKYYIQRMLRITGTHNLVKQAKKMIALR